MPDCQAKSQIQPLTPANQVQCATAYHIQCQCRPVVWSEAMFLDCLATPYFAFSLSVDAQVQGYLLALQVLDEVTLMDVGVAPACRGLGYGRQLVSHLCEQAVGRHARQIFLEVRAGNQVAIDLYHSLGFEQLDRRKNYYHSPQGKEDGLMMRLELAKG